MERDEISPSHSDAFPLRCVSVAFPFFGGCPVLEEGAQFSRRRLARCVVSSSGAESTDDVAATTLID